MQKTNFFIFLIIFVLSVQAYIHTSPVSVQDGGTGLTTVGTANYVLASNSTATALTYRPSASILKVSASTSSRIICTGLMPNGAIPTNTQGVEVLTVSITPTSASSILEIKFTTWGFSGQAPSAALFQDSTVNALAAVYIGWPNSAGGMLNGVLRYRMTAGTTSSTTFKIRVGCDGTFRINGNSSTRWFGGVAATYLTVEEFAA